MKAIVCDKCGKVVLLDETDCKYYGKETGVYFLCSDAKQERKLDLCEECAKELMAAVRKE